MFLILILVSYYLYTLLVEQLSRAIPIPPHRQSADNNYDSITLNLNNLCFQLAYNQEWYNRSSKISWIKTICLRYLSKIILLQLPLVSNYSKIILDKLLS